MTVRPILKAGLSLASASTRGVRPHAVVDVRPSPSPAASYPATRVAFSTSTGMISSAKRPSAMAAAAFWWLAQAKASWSSRPMPYLLGHQLGGDPHGGVGLGPVATRLGIGAVLVAPHRHHGHRLGAAGDDAVGKAGHDPLGGHGDGLQPRGAEAVDGLRRGPATGSPAFRDGDPAPRSSPAPPRGRRSRG